MRQRLVAAMVAVAAVALLLLAVPLAVAVDHSARADEVIQLQRVAATIGVAVPTDYATLADPVELPGAGRGRVAALYDTSGHRVAGRGPAVGDRAVRQALAGGSGAARAGGLQVVAVPLAVGESVRAVVRVAAPEAEAVRRAERAWAALAALAVGVLAVAALAARLLAGRLTRPLRRLAEAAGRLGEGDFTVTVGRTGIGETDAVAAALEATAERLGAVLERERAFSADASHALLTPVAALRLRLETALDDPGADRDAALRAALGQVDRLQATVDGLLALRRDLTATGHRSTVEELADGLRGQWHGRLGALGRPLRITVGDPAAVVAVAAGTAGQVLDVLVDNARQHGSGAVTVAFRDGPGVLAVDVADEGPGVTDPGGAFRRRVRPAPGHGIGLAMARSLAEADGGRLELSHAGPSPTFTAVWPLDRSGAASDGAASDGGVNGPAPARPSP